MRRAPVKLKRSSCDPQGVELLKVTLTGYRLHIDGLFVMLAPDLALANITLAARFGSLNDSMRLGSDELRSTTKTTPPSSISLAIAPGRVIMPEGVSEHTQDQLRLAGGCKSSRFPYDKMIAGGGGPPLLLTAPLVRGRGLIMAAEFSAPQNHGPRLAKAQSCGAVGRSHDDLETSMSRLGREYKSFGLVHGPARARGFSRSERGTAGMPTRVSGRRWSNGAGPTLAGYAEYDAVPGQSQAPEPRRKPRERNEFPRGPATPTRIRRSASARLGGFLAAKHAMEDPRV